MSSISPFQSPIQRLIEEVHQINETIKPSYTRPSAPLSSEQANAFLQRIERCAEESFPFFKEWNQSRNVNTDPEFVRLATEMQTLRRYCKALKLDQKSEKIKQFVEIKLSPLKIGGTALAAPVAEFLSQEELKKMEQMDEKNWKSIRDLQIIARINRNESIQDLHLNRRDLLQIAEKYGEKITCLNLQGLSEESFDLVLLNYLPNLKSLKMSNLFSKDLMFQIIKHPNLKELEELKCFGCNKIGDVGACLIGDYLKKLKKLEVLKCGLTYEGISSIAQNLTGLESFNCSINEIGDAGASLIAEHLTKLKVLWVSSCGLTHIGIGSITHKLKELEELDCSYNEIGDAGVSLIAEHLTKLKVLSVSFCGFAQLGIGSITHKLKELEALYCSDNQIGDAGASLIAEYLTKLKILNVSSCGFTQLAIGSIVRKLKELEELDY